MKLHEAIALRKGEVGREKSELTEVYKTIQKPALFEGMSKSYEPVEEGSPTLPPENVRVQQNVMDLIRSIRTSKTSLWNTCATVDYGNMQATADVTLDDGTVVIAKVPVTHLLFLETQLTDLRTIVEKLPTLSPDFNWQRDTNSGLYFTDPVQTHRTEKVKRAIVLYPATDKHPAQTQLVDDSALVGFWTQVKRSGAIPATEKAVMLSRVQTMLDAVKTARARANGEDAPKMDVASPILNFIFG